MTRYGLEFLLNFFYPVSWFFCSVTIKMYVRFMYNISKDAKPSVVFRTLKK